MNTEEVIKKIITENSIGILKDTDKFIKTFEQIVPDMKKEKAILKCALEIGTADYFINIPENIMNIIGSISLARENMNGILTENMIEMIIRSMMSAVIADSFKVCGADSVMISEGFAESVKKNIDEVKKILAEKNDTNYNPNDFVIGSGVLSKYLGKGGDVIIPDGVKIIGNAAFSNHKHNYNSKENREWGELSGCVALVSVTIPESVEEIEYDAFFGCINLRKVIMSRKIKVANSAFNGCRQNIIEYTD